MKKTVFILFAAMFTITFAVAQEGSSERSSLSIILLDYEDQYSQTINELIEGLTLDARYDVNKIPTTRIMLSGRRTQADEDGDYAAPNRTQSIQTLLNNNNIGQEIISYLFRRNTQTGEMSLRNIYDRGMYNASDQDVIERSATKRGISDLKDDGFSLIDNSHIMVLDYTNIRYEYKSWDGNDGDYYWYATPAVYLFKIKWNETLQNQLFDCWIDRDTPIAERSKKKTAFEKLYVPVNFVSIYMYNSCSKQTGINAEQKRVNEGKERRYTAEELRTKSFREMILEAADYLGEQIERKYDAFQIQNSIYAVHPIRAKIGKKEGLKTNDRYYVYEYVSIGDNKTKAVRKGVVKATSHIVHNEQVATGKSPTSEFYQIAGGKLDEGMTLKEKPSYYVNLDLGYRYGNLEGIYAGISTSFYATRVTNHNVMVGATVWDEAVTVNLDYGFGLRCNNFDIYPYIGVGVDSFFKEEDESEADSEESMAWLGQGGIRFNLNIYYPVQLFGAAEYNYLLWEGDNYVIKKELKDRNVEGLSFYGGLRICF